MRTDINETERAALEVLRKTGVDVLEAALVAKDALQSGRGRVKRARACITLGAAQMQLQEKTVSFSKAVSTALEDGKRKGLRARTIVDTRYFCRRLMRMNPGLAGRRMRSITAKDCRRFLETAFGNSASQFRKARAVMSGVFATAIRHEWCDSNPVSRVEVPEVEERPIHPLTMAEVRRLETAVQQPEHRDMRLSLHLMLYCGIRPAEVSRIDPERDIDWQNRCVVVRPKASKTGGGRVVPLRCLENADINRKIPRHWQHRWRELRKAAGWCAGANPWRQDVCRHTFATYHAAYFRNFHELQLEMGHRDCSLLRTRYVYAFGAADEMARRFFRVPGEINAAGRPNLRAGVIPR